MGELSDADATGLLDMMAEAERLKGLTTKEIAMEASERLPLLGPDCLLADEVIMRLRKLAAWEIRKARSRH
jgi:hypothetical protein